jgi:protein TonB
MMRRYALAAATSAAVHAAALAAVIGWPGGTTAPEPQVIAVTLVAPEPPKALSPQAVVEAPPPQASAAPPEPKPEPKPAPPKAAPVERKKARAEPRPAPAETLAALEPAAPAAAPAAAAPAVEAPQAALAAPPAPARPAGPTLPVRQAGNPRPAYPAFARERGLEGQVLLRVAVSAEGVVREVTVLRSSGYSSLDRAARDAVQAWRFQPAMIDGEPRDGAIEFPVTFRLDGQG